MRIIYILLIITISSSAIANEKRETGDFNFDGHEDYRVYIMSNGKSRLFEYHLYNPTTKQYDKSEALFNLSNPEFDKKNRIIKTFMPGGHSGKIYVSEVYKWESNNLLLMSIEKQSWLSKVNSYIRVTVERENGQMRVTHVEAIQ